MIAVDIPGLPEEKAWAPPVDDDLYWISMLNFLGCQVFKALNADGAQLRQVEEGDALQLITDGNTAINEMVADIQAVFTPPPPDQ